MHLIWGKNIHTILQIIYINFFHEVISKRRELLIDDNNLDLLINCDETAVFFESPERKTICLKETKDITINTFGNDKQRISLLLAVCGNGKKLAPLLIFKGKGNKTTEKNLNNHCKRKKICNMSE